MQPYFFPYIGYWQLIHAVDRFVIYDDVNYMKGGWINRNRILINGGPTYITVPLQRASPNKRICDISVQSSTVWRDKLARSIKIAYSQSPCFVEAFPVIETVIQYESDNLSEYLANQLRTLSAFIGIQTEFVLNSRSYRNNGLTGQERVIDICKHEDANTYINAQGGQGLYDRGTFAQSGLDLKFLIPSPVKYKQFGGTCVPWLSIVDVMMFNSKSQLRTLLDKYELV